MEPTSSVYQCIFIIHPRDDDVDPLFLVALIQLELSGGRIGAREHKRTRAHSGGGEEDDHLDGIFRSLLMAPHIILSLPHCHETATSSFFQPTMEQKYFWNCI